MTAAERNTGDKPMTDIPNSRRSPMEHERDMPDAQTDAPERIWAMPIETVSNEPSWIDEIEVSHPDSYCGHDETGTEYVRADIHDAAQAEIAKLREALTAMIHAEVDYMMFNDLGDPEMQHNVKIARAAIAQDAKP